MAESFHLLEEALRSRVAVPSVIASENVRDRLHGLLAENNRIQLALLPDRVFESVAGTGSTQGVMALVKPRSWRIEQLFTACSLVVVLDAVQDPGNAGAMVRAAEAFGATGVIFGKGSAGPHHPKTLRASAGSLFRVPYVAAVEPAIARAALDANRLCNFVAEPGPHADSLDTLDFRQPCAFIIGNEGSGVRAEFRAGSTPVTIPTEKVESLNATIAGAIFLYEAHRQRRNGPV